MRSVKNYVGGQAVLEGVLMKVQDKYAIAVRKQDGSIKVTKQRFLSQTARHHWLNIPFVRGMIILFEMLGIGIKALSWSANQQLSKKEQVTTKEMLLSFVLSLGLSLGLFVFLPYFVSSLVHQPHSLQFHILDGILRFIIFLVYLLVLSYLKDIRRLYQYHGAEHKTVNCYESGMPLTVQNVKMCPTEHLRCGTSLIFFVVALSIVLFSFIRTELWWLNILVRILLIPVLVGISYEVLRLSARFPNSKLVRTLIQPGLWIQGLTAKEPDEQQIEVAIVSMKAAL